MKLSKREKNLIFALTIIALWASSVTFIIKPGLDKKNSLVQNIVSAEDESRIMTYSIEALPKVSADVAEAKNKLSETLDIVPREEKIYLSHIELQSTLKAVGLKIIAMTSQDQISESGIVRLVTEISATGTKEQGINFTTAINENINMGISSYSITKNKDIKIEYVHVWNIDNYFVSNGVELVLND